MEGDRGEKRRIWQGKQLKNLFFQEQIRREMYVTNEIIVEQELRRAKESSNHTTGHGRVRLRVRGATWGGRESMPPLEL